MSMDERAAKLRERISQDYAEAWDFKEIPQIVGVVESYSKVSTDNGLKVVCTIREVEGPEEAQKRYAVWLSQTALLRRFEELRPVTGELVAISYLGESDHVAKPGYNPAHRFRVEVDRQGADFDWESLGPDREARGFARDEMTREEVERAMARYHDERPPHDDSDIPF
jgi:hypothetical protein